MELSKTSIGIIGLGLMGGSLAMAIRGAAGRVVGFDKSLPSALRAEASGVVDRATTDIAGGVSGVDLVVLAVPVESIVTLVKALPGLRPDGCMVMDLGSTKVEVVQAMEALPKQFEAIGGHPMCGREQSGIGAALVDLFVNETFVLCRNRRSTPNVEEMSLSIVKQIGSRPLFLDASEHDRLVAASSHLPYVVSALLMERAWATAQEDGRLWQVSASGLRDATRLAGSSPEMMLEIMMTNRTPLLAQLEAYGEALAIVTKALRQKDRTALRSILEEASARRSAYMREKYDNEGGFGAE